MSEVHFTEPSPRQPPSSKPAPAPTSERSGKFSLRSEKSGFSPWRTWRHHPEPDSVGDISILVVTWNVGNQAPHPDEVKLWLPEQGGSHDIVVIGTQENAFKDTDSTRQIESRRRSRLETRRRSSGTPQVDLSVITVSRGSAFSERGDDSDEDDDNLSSSGVIVQPRDETPAWRFRRNGRSTLGPKRSTTAHAFDLMCAEHLGGGWVCAAHTDLRQMRLSVYSTLSLAKSIHHVSTARAATGVGGVVGNKGGLIVRLDVATTSFAFVSCHLAAHEGAAPLAARNAMCRKVLLKTVGDVAGAGRKLDAAHAVDHVVWLGDLNYRIELPNDEVAEHHPTHFEAVHAMVGEGRWAELMASDQLRAAQRAGDAFVGFREGEPSFAPTFKLRRQAGLFYNEQRTPSYTDRVLWKSMPPCEGRLALTELRSVEQVSTSDHKPVACSFCAKPSPQAPIPDVGRASPNGERGGATATIRVDELRVLLHGDVDLSNCVCCFYSHPVGLLAGRGPLGRGRAERRAQRWRLRPHKEAVPPPASPSPSDATSQASPRQPPKSARYLAMAEHAKLVVRAPPESLRGSCLLVAFFELNASCMDLSWSTKQPLGVVTIPLGRHYGTDAAKGYTVPVDAPIVLGHSTAGTGRLSCNLRIERQGRRSYSFGRSLFGAPPTTQRPQCA